MFAIEKLVVGGSSAELIKDHIASQSLTLTQWMPWVVGSFVMGNAIIVWIFLSIHNLHSRITRLEDNLSRKRSVSITNLLRDESMLALDSETNGVDFHHGARPFFVTLCDPDGRQTWWEWDVDPLTRKPIIPSADVKELASILTLSGDRLVLQNGKFDYTALGTIGLWEHMDLEAVWADTYDTLISGHLLASNQPHNLTDMAVHYLGVDILPLENKLREATLKARREAKAQYPKWALAKSGRADMPSAGDKTWKYDTWLPRALAKANKLRPDHVYWRVLSNYANADSAVTMRLWQVHEALLKERGLWKVFESRMKILPVTMRMEHKGVTLNSERVDELASVFKAEAEQLGNECETVAAELNIELTMPKGGNSKALVATATALIGPLLGGLMGQQDSVVYDASKGRDSVGIADTLKATKSVALKDLKIVRTPTGQISLNKYNLELFTGLANEGSQLYRFFASLREKRRRDTGISYLQRYKRYWQGLTGDTSKLWKVLHPSLNITGTDTLRGSSNHPNAQNISKQKGFNLRYAFGPPPGYEWWDMDYENIELRIPAYEAEEHSIIDLFERANEPPYYGSEHLLNFSVVYPDIWAEALRKVGEEQVGEYIKTEYKSTWYQWCKNGDFAVAYGAICKPDGTGTADRAFHRPGSHAKLLSRFARKEALNRKYIQMAEKYGYVTALPDKTVDPDHGYPVWCSRSEWGKIIPTVPLNYHVQSTAMQCTWKAMVRCDAQLREWGIELNKNSAGWRGSIIMQVHDEIVFEFPKGKTPRANLPKVLKLKRLMEQSGDDIGVPLRVGVEYVATNWAEGEKVKV